jgi:putative heme-binding domain-containing protein
MRAILRSPAFLAVVSCGLLGAAADDPEATALRVLPGFSIQRFADEKLGVIKPTQIRFDGNGRLWVATTTSYPQIRPGEEPRDRIVVLEDTDGDGQADRSTVFADNLHIPLGIELGDGGVYVGATDELLFLRDTDGDGKADERRVVFSGFGTGDTHQGINSFTWGPAGELILSQGLHAVSRIETPSGNVALHQAGIWRFWPHRLKLEPFWDGAMGPHNPFGTVFDRNGRPLVFAGNGHGIYDLVPAMVPAGHFLLQPSIWSGGRKFGGADIADNSHWPEASRGEFVAGGYLQNTVERFRISPSGSSFQVQRLAPLVESTNTAFRVVDVRFGPDGALYLCDWYNPVIGHYQTSFRHPDRDKTHGRIWRVSADNRMRVNAPRLETAPVADLLGQLLSPERWNQQQAARILRDRPASEVSGALKKWLGSAGSASDREDRAGEAVGILTALNLPDPALLDELAASTRLAHRARAARYSGLWSGRIPDPLPRLARLAADAEPAVRLEAVVACAWIADFRAVETASIAADQPMDAMLRYAFIQCVHALKPLWIGPYSGGRLAFGGVAARQQAFTEADRSGDTARFSADRLRRISEVALDAETQWSLVETVLTAGRPEDLPVLIARRTYTVGETYQPERHAMALRRLAGSADVRTHLPGEVAKMLEVLIASGAPEVRGAAAQLAGALRISAVEDLLVRIVEDTSTPDLQRADAIRGLGRYASKAHAARIAIAAASGTDEVAIAAVGALAGLEPVAAARIVAERLAMPKTAAVVDSFLGALLQYRDGAPALANALAQRRPDLASARAALAFLARAGRPEPELRRPLLEALGSVAAEDRSALATAGAAQDAFLTEVRETGNAERGRRLFARPELGCTTCHGIGATAPGLGPDLAALGTSQTPGFIVGAILDPQREVKEGFMSWLLMLEDGTVHQGRLVNETAAEVVLFDASERRELHLRSGDIAERTRIGSIMPAGLADTLTREELADLVRFLSGLGRRQ